MRSQVDTHERPNVVFRVLSPAALDRLDESADRAGLTRSEFIRRAIADAMARQSGGGGVATSRSSRRPHPPDRRTERGAPT